MKKLKRILECRVINHVAGTPLFSSVKAKKEAQRVVSAIFTDVGIALTSSPARVNLVRVRKALQKLSDAKEITLVFVGTAEMKRLNKQYRGKSKPTDVLSFSPVVAESLGELVFCIPTIKQQAKDHKMTYREEFLYLLIHGVLHLLGYDHEINDKQAREMYRLQDCIFEDLRSSRKR
jgi:probable rRNA maturation factor